MKVYQIRNGVMCEAEAPDGALNLALKSTANPEGGVPLPPIVQMHRGEGWFQRDGRERERIPERTYKADDLDWRPVSRP